MHTWRLFDAATEKVAAFSFAQIYNCTNVVFTLVSACEISLRLFFNPKSTRNKSEAKAQSLASLQKAFLCLHSQ